MYPKLPGRRAAAVALGVVVSALLLLAPSVAAQPQTPDAAVQAGEQVLTWRANDSITSYASAPATATAGTATVVFENSAATGNTTGMPHTLTFDTSTEGYNHDVDLNITASPYDANGGRYEVQVNLTPGTYRYFCAMSGHEMSGELVVTDGGGADTTPPQVAASVTGDQNADGAYVGGGTVTLSATDAESGVESVEYALDGQPYAAYTAPVTVNEPGDHTVSYRATDKAGNTSPAGSVTFTVVEPPAQDTTPPEVSASVSGDKDGDGSYVGAATVTVSARDDQSGVDSVEYSLDGGPFAEYTDPVAVDQPGDHNVGYRATDKAGNVAATQEVSFTVAATPDPDGTAPEVSASVSGDKNADGDYVGTATVTLSATDTESGVASVEYALDDAGFAEYTAPVSVGEPGDHRVRYRATDEAGNTSEVSSVAFTVVEPPSGDTAPPDVSALVSGSQDWAWNYVGSATVTVSATDARSGVSTVEYSLDGQPFATYAEPFDVIQPGQHHVEYRATDQAGNTSDVGTAHFTVVESKSDKQCSSRGRSNDTCADKRR